MEDHVALCKCTLHKIPIGCGGVHWYWSMHTKHVCYMDEPDGPCWCGNMRSMHWNGHAPSSDCFSLIWREEQFDNARIETEKSVARERAKRGIK